MSESAVETHDGADIIEEPPVVNEPVAEAITAPIPITTQKKSRVGIIGLTIVGLLSGGAYAFNHFGGEELVRSRVAKAPKIDATPGGEQLNISQRYQDGIRQVNVEGAQEAAETLEKSFMPIPDKAVEPAMLDIDAPKVKAKRKPPLPPANKPRQVVKAPKIETKTETIREYKEVPVYYEVKKKPKKREKDDWSDIDALTKSMMRQGKGVADRHGRAKTEVIIRQKLGPQSSLGTYDAGTYGADASLGMDYLVPSDRKKLPVRTGKMPKCFNPYGYGPGGVFGCPKTAPGGILAKAGDVVYARIVNGTDTDTPGPLVAEITSGELDGARLIGSFTANRETTAMIVQFDRVVLEDGTNIPTSAYAVDALYGDLAVRSRYDGRYFQRYGPKLAGAFLRGAGAAFAATGNQVVGVGETAVVVTPEQSAREALAAGVSDVGNQLASEIENLGPENGLVQLFAGKPVGILWLANVRAPEDG